MAVDDPRTCSAPSGDPALPPDRTATLVPRPSSPMIHVAPEGHDGGDADGDDDLARSPARPASPAGADDPDRYEQIAEHARGGLGRVVRAFDTRLGRTVAVKELLRRGDSHETRFLREALITARLEHPGIVPVHEAGRWPNGDPYYVMKLVSGRTLKELILEHPTPRRRLALLPHAIAVADAVGYAHSEGVIHRDLKPSNVVVGAFGDTIVVDWGLARDRKRADPDRDDDDDRIAATSPHGEVHARGSRNVSTVSGKVVGTPAYMSPEQARGDLVDERADVYAIGAILYEMLAGTPPYADDTPQAVLDRVVVGPPRPLLEVVPGTPVDLATIVGKAMARDPDARYRNATALAEDLRRYQTGQLVSAHSYTPWSLMRRKLSRHRAALVVACAGVLALGTVGVASVQRVVAERNIARSERGRAQLALGSAEQRQRQLVLLQAVTSLRKDPTAALAWLKLYPVAVEDRDQVIDVIDEAVALGVARHVFRPGDWVFDTAFTPDGNTLIAAVRDGVLRAYDLRTGAVRELGHTPSSPEVLALSPSGDVVVTGGVRGDVVAWPVTGGPARTLVDRGVGVLTIRFDGDGGHIIVDRESGLPEDIDVTTGERSPIGPRGAIRVTVADDDWSKQVSLSTPNQLEAGGPTGTRPLAHTDKQIAFVGVAPNGETVIVHDGAMVSSVPYAGGPLRPLVKYDGRLVNIAFAPDQRSIALFGTRPEIVIVELATAETRELRGHTDAIYNVEYTRDGRSLLSASDDGTARVWNLADGSATELRGHDDDVYRARFSPDERMVATASLDGSVRVWTLDQPGARVFTEGPAIETLSVHGDRVIAKTAGTLAAWDLITGAREELFSWAQDRHGLGVGVSSPDGTQLLIPGADWSMEIRRHDEPPLQLRGHHGQLSHVEWSRDGATLYTSSFDGSLRRWDLATGASTALIDGSVPVRGFAVAADGRVAAQVGDTATIISPAGVRGVLGTGETWCTQYAEFERVRDRLVMHRCDHSLVLVDRGRQIELATAGYMATRIAVSPDGNRIAGAMNDRTVRVWDAATGEVQAVLRGHSDLVMDVAFSPDGRELASASYDKTVWIWELASARHRVLRGHGGAVERVVWRDQNRLVTGSRDGTVRVWDVPALTLPAPGELAARLHAATSAEIDRDDRPTTTPSNETPAKLDLGAMLNRSVAAGHS